MLALELLVASAIPERGPLCAVFGDDDYLKRESLLALRGGEGAEFFTGKEADWRDVHDALTTISLFGDSADVVVIEDADTFVTEYRDKLETWVDKPQSKRCLILEVKTWPKTTRLAKATDKKGLAIECSVPTDNKQQRLTKFTTAAKKWLTHRAKHVHQATLDRGACDQLFEQLPLALGLMDQEVAKLSLMADDGKIDTALVVANVGDWRTRQTWDMIDAMVEGRSAEAIKQLDKLLAAGEEPIPILAQVAYTLRKFATASRLVEQAEAAGKRPYFPQIMAEAGFWPSIVDRGTQQLKSIGRGRAVMLSTWLLEMDMAMKGHNSDAHGGRLELERLIARLSPAAAPKRPAATS
ncbi:DNA polymerase III subunit delta [Aeoliella sp. SH292]|uniref:DNA polymerase III subunit delta n=1 Tax=Aeoliella sp. SH292 TaxID=3454464 RepID=UPI003F961546